MMIWFVDANIHCFISYGHSHVWKIREKCGKGWNRFCKYYVLLKIYTNLQTIKDIKMKIYQAYFTTCINQIVCVTVEWYLELIMQLLNVATLSFTHNFLILIFFFSFLITNTSKLWTKVFMILHTTIYLAMCLWEKLHYSIWNCDPKNHTCIILYHFSVHRCLL